MVQMSRRWRALCRALSRENLQLQKVTVENNTEMETWILDRKYLLVVDETSYHEGKRQDLPIPVCAKT